MRNILGDDQIAQIICHVIQLPAKFEVDSWKMILSCFAKRLIFGLAKLKNSFKSSSELGPLESWKR